MKTIYFYKLTGAGNDFILFDKKDNPYLEITPEFALRVCSRRFGIGSDGIILVCDSKKYDFEMEYFNADGSTGTLCGNGARCGIKFAKFSGRIKGNDTVFAANGVQYSGKIISDEKIRFNLNEPKNLKQNITISAKGQLIKASYIDTGSPHVVINVKNVLKNISDEKSFYSDLNELPVVEFGREIRYSDTFAPEGVNVNFISVENENLRIRTYERGVEEETLACGTGAVASALISFLNSNIAPPITLYTKGGDELTVDFLFNEKSVSNLSLTGPAGIVFKGEITI